jgi:hypothetical protein
VSVYLPQNAATLWQVAGVLLGILILGFGVTRMRSLPLARCFAWALAAGSVLGVERICSQEPAGFRMVAIIMALLWALKAVVSAESQCAGQPPLLALRWFAFAALWPGMRPALFATAGKKARPGAGRLLSRGARGLAVGAALVGLARLVWSLAPEHLPEDGARLLATLLVLPGLSFLLHFGVCNLLAGAWRLAGIDCRPLFHAPLRSRSLHEFWGQRWNLAFVELAALAVYRPLGSRLGKGLAIVATFLFSGVLHELVISVPVGAGYGLPLLYFTLHGLLVLGERHLEEAGYAVDRNGWVGWFWTLSWLVLPLPLLFHPPFLQGVVWPLLGMDVE